MCENPPPESYANSHSVAELAEPLRSRIAKAMADAPHRDLVIASGKRTDYQQWVIRHQRCPNQECNRKCKGDPQVALPGTSNHRNLDADHCAVDMDGVDVDWLGANQKRYGLHRPVKGEKWHFEPNDAGPTIKIPTYRDPRQSATWTMIKPGDTNSTIEARGGLPGEVTELQSHLTMFAKLRDDARFDPKGVDGDYGKNSQKAVVQFKKWVIQLQKKLGQKQWPNSDEVVGKKTIEVLRFWTP